PSTVRPREYDSLLRTYRPFFSHASPAEVEVWYRRALLASAASWALRLHQRLKTSNVGFSRATLETLVTEDAFHYLVYSIIFALLTPVSGQGTRRPEATWFSSPGLGVLALSQPTLLAASDSD
ncbi:transmembrane protein 33, partial [Paragonimus westermani]